MDHQVGARICLGPLEEQQVTHILCVSYSNYKIKKSKVFIEVGWTATTGMTHQNMTTREKELKGF